MVGFNIEFRIKSSQKHNLSRICGQRNMVGKTQHEGGSEITQVSADDAKGGTARGSGQGGHDQPFNQIIEVNVMADHNLVPRYPSWR